MTLDQLIERVKQDESEIVGVCRDLVRIPSENPPGDTTKVFAYAQELLHRWSFPFRLLEPAPGRQNLIATWDSDRPGKHLVFNGHLDVLARTSSVATASSWSISPPIQRQSIVTVWPSTHPSSRSPSRKARPCGASAVPGLVTAPIL